MRKIVDNYKAPEPPKDFYDDVDLSRVSEAIDAYIDLDVHPPSTLDGEKRLQAIFGEKEYKPYMGFVIQLIDAALTPVGMTKIKEIFPNISKDAIKKLSKYSEFINGEH